MERETEVDADIQLQHYDITVLTGWTGGGDDPGGNAVTVYH
jgi:hypothetical protein